MESTQTIRVQLAYPEPLLAQVVNRWWVRTVLPWLAGGLLLFGTPLAVGLVQGDRSWLVGAAGAMVLAITVLALQIRTAHRRHVTRKLRSLGGGRVLLEISDCGLRFEFAQGSMQLRWSELHEIHAYREYWLLLRAPNDFFTLPLASIDAVGRAMLRAGFDSAGVRIRDFGFR